ncbi:MAG: glycosyltransferase family 39 protein [Planctomycetota bacterium]
MTSRKRHKPAGRGALEKSAEGAETGSPSRKRRKQGARRTLREAAEKKDWLKHHVSGRLVAVCAAALLAAFALQAITSISRKSVTTDEVAHLPAGYSYLKTCDFRMNPEHPPLIKVIAALPLLAMDVDGGFDKEEWEARVEEKQGVKSLNPDDEWDYGWRFLFHWNDAKTVIFWGRVMMVAMSLGAGLLVFFWARELYGNAAGLFALFLFCFSPNILAHARLVNTDMGLAFFCLLALYCFDRALRKTTPVRVALAGLTLGLALLVKYSALPILPVLFALTIIRIAQKTPVRAGLTGESEIEERGRRILPYVALWVGVLLITWMVIWAGYGFKFRAIDTDDRDVQEIVRTSLPLETKSPLNEPSFWRHTHGPYKFAMEHKLLPQAFLYGFQYITHSTSGRRAFLDGEHSVLGWRHYFIMTLLYKTPVPTLAFLGVTLLLTFWLSRGRWYYEMPLIILFIVFYAIALSSNINIGHRHILPILPVIFIFVSKLVNHIQRPLRSLTVPLAAIFGLLAGWYLVGTVLIWPDYLAYFNEPSGGPDNGYKHLTDSNIDWGQDLVQLKEFMDEHNIERVHLAYFGMADPHYYGIEYDWIFGLFYRIAPRYPDDGGVSREYVWIMTWSRDPDIVEMGKRNEKPAKIEKGDWVVIGVSHYMDTILPSGRAILSSGDVKSGLQLFVVLRDKRLVGKLNVDGRNYYGHIGHSMLVFHMKEDLDMFETLKDFYDKLALRGAFD